jgi:CheY-like chemotaxis protein
LLPFALLGHDQKMQVRGTILVVDDDDDTRTCVMAVLEEEGYEVLGSNNGVEALAILRGGYVPDLVLLDLMMPVMSGWEMLEELTKAPKLADLPVVVFTAAGDPVPRGAKLTKPVVRKPIDVDLLLRMVNDYCRASMGLDEPPSDLMPKISHPS